MSGRRRANGRINPRPCNCCQRMFRPLSRYNRSCSKCANRKLALPAMPAVHRLSLGDAIRHQEDYCGD
jgi:hypothetical protein